MDLHSKYLWRLESGVFCHFHSSVGIIPYWMNFQCGSWASGFVSMSATISLVETYRTTASPFLTRSSQTKWYFCWMCLVRVQNCGSQDRIIAAWFSQNNSVGVFCECPSSLKKEQSQARCCSALLSQMYSDSVVESATMLCCLLDQEIAPWLLMKIKPEVEQELSGSCDHPTLECPWKSMSVDSSMPSKRSSVSFVAWMYRSTRFTASQWLNMGLARKWLSAPMA